MWCELKHPDRSLLVASPAPGETFIQLSAYMMLAVTASAKWHGAGKGPGFPHVARLSSAAILLNPGARKVISKVQDCCSRPDKRIRCP
ncbi:protein of unknown function [Shinella sp. WSC3-e]|nr:protein of unknown function [Shinella sp. WSC3-e]